MANQECFVTLAQAGSGEIQLCRGCLANVSFRFNNIFQVMSPDEFRQLFHYVNSLDAHEFFSGIVAEPGDGERRIYLGTTVQPLYFCFTQPELAQLKSLLFEAVSRLATLEKAWTDLN